MLEAGGEGPVPGNPDILAAQIDDDACHDPTEIVAASALGGTSHWWGGRAVPFDPIDFRDWPIARSEMLPWYRDAADFLGAKAMQASSAPPRFSNLQLFDAEGEETWCPQVNMAKRWRQRLMQPTGPAILLRARAVGLLRENERVSGVRVRIGGEEHVARARHIVLACGGLGGLKLLLLAQRDDPNLFGGPDGPLGRSYMGHLTGTIANLAFADTADNRHFSYRDLGDGIFARRRLRTTCKTVSDENLPNTAFWIDDAYNENPSHQSSVASAKYVAARLVRRLASKGASFCDDPLAPHFRNIVRAPFSAASGLAHAGYLHARARLTGHLPRPKQFMPAQKGAWLMRYHAEQRPDRKNRISLSTAKTDSLGLPRLHISFRFSRDDCDGVVRTHELLDADLRRAGAGSLRWLGNREEALASVIKSAKDGYHQLGGAVMSKDAKTGIVDTACRVHDFTNLWIASSSVFPTGSQANPTLTIVALSRRLAKRLSDNA
jgi:choline dehydrogenase-like flavoprotein